MTKVEVYEWTFFDWEHKGSVLTSGFGIYHTMVWSQNSSGWKVVSDDYDERQLLGAPSHDSKAGSIVRPATSVRSNNDASKESSIKPLAFAYYPYNRNLAASYADSYVYRYASGGYYPASYNSAYYRNYNNPNDPNSGDCANFVSQGVRAGQAPFVNFGVNDSVSWWYNNNGTEPNQTGDDTASATWTYVPSHRSYMLYLWGTQVSASQLQKGDIVYYDWHGDGVWDHTAIVAVGAADNGGVALVDSHTLDFWQIRWDYGYGDTTYFCVHLSDQLPVYFN